LTFTIAKNSTSSKNMEVMKMLPSRLGRQLMRNAAKQPKESENSSKGVMKDGQMIREESMRQGSIFRIDA
jgi:hypothetical protein